jgi:hypothetical protein
MGTAIMGTGEEPRVIKVLSAAKTITQDDHNTIIEMNSASAQVLTVRGPLPKGFFCTVIRTGAGSVTLAAGANLTLNSVAGALGLSAQYAVASIICYDNNIAVLSGSLA